MTDRLICNKNLGKIENINIITNSNDDLVNIVYDNSMGFMNSIHAILSGKSTDINSGLGNIKSLEWISKKDLCYYNDEDYNNNEIKIINPKDLEDEELKQKRDSAEFEVIDNKKLRWKPSYIVKYFKPLLKLNTESELKIESQEDFDNFIKDLINNKNTYKNVLIKLYCDVKYVSEVNLDEIKPEFDGRLDGNNHKIDIEIKDSNSDIFTGLFYKLGGTIANLDVNVIAKSKAENNVYGLVVINLGIISNVNIYSEIKRKLESNYISICDINTGLIENTLISIHFVGFLLFFWMLFPLLGLILLSLLLFKGCSKDEGEIIDKKDIIEVTEENDKIKPSLAVIDDTEETTYADNLNVMSFEFPFGMIVDKSSMTGYFDFYAPERGNKDIKVEIWYGDECLYSSDILKPGDRLGDIKFSKGVQEGTYDMVVFIVPYMNGELVDSLRTQLPFEVTVK